MHRLRCLLLFCLQCFRIGENKSISNVKPVGFGNDPLLDEYDLKYNNPNIGYEPYWPHGEWLIQDPNEGANVSTTKIPTVCGDECNSLYMDVGEVCAHRADNLYYDGCWYFIETIWYHCNADIIDTRVKGYVTFDNYCAFLDAKCKAPESEKYGLAHFGKCLEDQNTMYKGVNVASDIVSRMTAYLASVDVGKK
ncbi:uncharacterized protein LOC116413196 [Galleria mellonella]|uniref:Uncharacterized protein LOC116413196 n=1 Tax=Galleria mellonella TaxID=7137 RepID=A0ABM3MY90_GALME|nr:uncharacterized protein LOC116413196 [Galleria mellonella]